MANNEILPFAGTDNGTNLLTQAEYNADSQRPIGNQPGVARSKLVNKVLRQTSLIAAAVAQFLANRQSADITDSLTPATLAGYMLNAIGGDIQKSSFNASAAGGTADAITGTFTPAITALSNGLSLFVRAGAANTATIPTFTPNNGTVTAKAIVKGANQALVAGDIAGAGHWLELQYDATLDKWVLQNPANGIVVPASQQPGEVCFFAQNTAPSGFLKANGATVSRSSYAALFAALVKSSTATITIASPAVVTWAAHGRSANDPVKFTTTGTLPTGLTAGTTYYVVGASITTNTFQVSAAAGGAAINTSGSQSGVHTVIHAPFGDGDGSTTFVLPDMRGYFPRGWDDSRGIDPSRTFGSSQADLFASHAHGVTQYGQLAQVTAGGTGNIWDGTGAGATGAAGGTETRPKNVALLACIKY